MLRGRLETQLYTPNGCIFVRYRRSRSNKGKKHAIMQKLLAATMLATSFAASAFAADPVPATPAATTPGTQADTKSPWVTVASVENLIGRKLRDPQGHDAGEIHSLVVNIQSGMVPYAVVDSNGSFHLDGKFVAVPFSELKLSRTSDIMNVMVPAEKLAKAKRFSEDQIDDLAKPQEVASIYSYYAVPKPVTATSPTASATQNEHYTLVRHDTVVQMNAGKHMASDIQGETVKGADGKDVGEIDKIMIDTTTGKIAYLLLSQGGFLGMGEDWIPLPPQALSWSAKDNVFVMTTAKADAKVQPALHKGAVPVQVRRAELKALYERFGVQAY